MIPSHIDKLIDRALEEDLASGDLTTEACVLPGARAIATAIARRPLVVCGGDVFLRVFQRVGGTDIETRTRASDGTFVERDAALWEVSGLARHLLMAERTALNFAQRMSGIATAARTYTGALAPGSKTRIADTRKTTPGLRVLERYAVRVGGAHNHRDNLGSAVLIKDNHIIAAGGIAAAVERARGRAPHTTRIEVEVANFAELDQALASGADIILLDNFSVDAVRKAVELVSARPQRPILEASGGITLERVRELSEAGVDVISVGALTHSAPAADIALDLTL